MELFLQALSDTVNIFMLAYIGLGVFIGIIVGAIPGMGPTMAIALCIPLTFYMTPISAVGFLMGILKGGVYGGSIASILLNTPGTPESAATTFDGYPMAQSGKPVKALKLALYASCCGDTLSALSLIVLSIPLAAIALKLSFSDLFAVMAFALVLIAGLEKRSTTKGIMAAALGMLVGTIGMDTYGEYRLYFGMNDLISGVPSVVVMVGVLSMSEIFLQLQRLSPMDQNAQQADGIDQKVGFREFWRHWITILRSGIIGIFIGALPGLGSTVAAFLGYGSAKRASKHPEAFGTGCIEGIIAPEVANNATSGSNLVPLLTLGIPGNLAAAVIVGALFIHGITPGPLMFQEYPDVIWGIYIVVLMAGFINLFLARFGLKFFTKAFSIDRTVLFPCIIYLCVVGGYLTDVSIFAAYLTVIFGCVGVLLRRFGYSFVTFAISLVLTRGLEMNLQQSLVVFNDSWMRFLERPVVVVMILASLYIIWRGFMPANSQK